MACKQADVMLVKFHHTFALWDDIADVLVILFQAALLVGNIGVTVEDIGTALSVFRELDPFRILEFRAVICKDDRERLLKEAVTEAVGQGIESLQDRFLVTPLHQDDDHEAAAPEEESEQTLAGSTGALHGIHLDNVKVRMSVHEAFEVLISPLVSVDLLIVLLPLFLWPFLPFPVPYTAWEIDVPCLEDALVKVVVEGPPADRDLILMDSEDMG